MGAWPYLPLLGIMFVAPLQALAGTMTFSAGGSLLLLFVCPDQLGLLEDVPLHRVEKLLLRG